MKNLLFFAIVILAITMTTQSFQKPTSKTMLEFPIGDFEKEWKKIDSLERQRLPKSALEEVNKLYTRAKNENNPSQIIKTLIYKGKYESQLEEDGFVEAINNLEAEAAKETFPVKSILHSMLGEMYQSYLDQNQWKFRNRTETIEFKTDDIRTWTMGQLIDKSSTHYYASLEDEKTQEVKIETLNALMAGNLYNDQDVRPTLFDFLAFRAINYFKNDQVYLTEPAYKFHLDDEQIYSPFGKFIHAKFTTKDSTARKYRTLLLFQKVLASRTGFGSDKNTTALIDADLKRLQFVHSGAVLDIKNELYEKALNDLLTKHENNPAYAEIAHQLASHIFSRNTRYQPVPFQEQKSDNQEVAGKWDYKTAHEICAKALKKYPNSLGATNCRALIKDIERKTLNVKLEKVYLPNQSLLGLLQYRNFKTAHFKIVKLTEKQWEEIKAKDWDQKLAFYNSLTAHKKWEEQLPDDGDFRSHGVEFKIPALKHGQYLLMVADNAEFSQMDKMVHCTQFQVSNLAYAKSDYHSDRKGFLIVDRDSGEPQKGVKVEFFENDYSRLRRRSEMKKLGTVISNKDGFAPFEKGNRNNFYAKFRKGEELLLSENWYYTHDSNNKRKPTTQIHFFLDRAIYRPGQTIYFKALAIEYDSDLMPKILKDKPLKIELLDANRQPVKSVDLITNEFGTVTGTFNAPAGGLLGRMTLRANGRSIKSFRVEEYKRPKFEVTFKPIEDEYRLGEKVTIKGHAKAYAGNNIDGAEITYRVTRTARFPYWSWRWGWYNPWQSSSMEITNGKAKTDENGEFEIEFEALPDRAIPRDRKPVFSYSVSADVTDITGETRSGNTNVSAGYVALDLSVADMGEVGLPIPAALPPDPLKREPQPASAMAITAKNLNGADAKTNVSVKFEKLAVPTQPFNRRYWNKPDRQLMSASEFKKAFPQFAYASEDDQKEWKTEKVHWSKDLEVEGKYELDLTKVKLNSGVYKIIAKAKDAYGAEVEVVKFLTAYERNGKMKPVPQVVTANLEQQSYEPSQIVDIQLFTSTNPLYFYKEVKNRGGQLSSGWLKIKTKETVQHKVTEADRGNMAMNGFAVKNNRFYAINQTILVPWSNKDLKVEYGTFRDKLKPGQEEEWVIKVTGAKKEKVAAEFVAAMYDASLDAFAANNWYLSPHPKFHNRTFWNTDNFGEISGQLWQRDNRISNETYQQRHYRELYWFNWNFGRSVRGRGREYMSASAPVDGVAMESMEVEKSAINLKRKRVTSAPAAVAGVMEGDANFSDDVSEDVMDSDEDSVNKKEPDLDDVPVRTNLNETVFFFPNLMTNAEGDVIVKFTMNEALTKWKFLGFAHTTDLQTAVSEKFVVTQKELMVQPNAPRFFRESDKIEFTAKVSNLTENDMNGTAQLLLFDALTDEPIDAQLGNTNSTLNFSAKAGQSDRLAWTLEVPIGGVSAIKHRVVARAGSFSDGEESVLPVLTNRMLVTETMPLPVRGKKTKTFTFKSMQEKSKSSTLTNHALTLEYTSNPAWYAVQALPYLMEYPYDCTEQITNRFYANALATHVANSTPKIKTIFDRWRDYEPDALKSNLSKNQELKTALLEETPWVLDAQQEEQQKQNIGILFDLNRMSYEMEATMQKLADRQEGNGGWSWFPGGRPNWYITQYVVESIGHLQRLGVRPMEKNQRYRTMIEKAIRYCDMEMLKSYEELERQVKMGHTTWEADHLGHILIHYLYTRSFFLPKQVRDKFPENMKQAGLDDQWADNQGVSMGDEAWKAYSYYFGQAEKYWTKKGQYQQGMIALGLARTGKSAIPADIVKSLKERSLNHDELGMYWKYQTGWFWYQAPIETHALMIEVFRDVANDNQSVDDLKVWLLKNKQTNNWKTTKATAAAVYALLMSGDDWLLEDQPVAISFPASSNTKFEKDINVAQKNAEAGTGYFKVKWDGKDVGGGLSTVKVKNPNKVVSWGGVYWQYFEQLDKITTFEDTPLTLKKQLFKVELSDTGEKIKQVSKSDLEVGDKLKVRIELRVDRDMEYVHMKDMRASGFEPMNVLSQYKWQGGLGYYESTRDASTNFFFDYLPKGTYVFEYPLRVQHNGDFSNGITTIQCMYAPEFTSHSEGERFVVEKE